MSLPRRRQPGRCKERPMDTRTQDPGPPSSRGPRTRRRGGELFREPEPGAPPGTLVIDEAAAGARTRIVLVDYDDARVEEKELASIDEVAPYLTDDRPSITWVDVHG